MNLKRLIYGLPFMANYRVRSAARAFFPKKRVPDGFELGSFPAVYGVNWEAAERDAFRTQFADCAGLVDVGANHGFYSAFAEHLGKPALAIEPERVNLTVLRRNVGAGVTVIPAAVSDKPGKIAFYGDGDMASAIPNWQTGAGRLFRQTVPAVTLDSIAADWLPGERLFIKVDVEGFEAAVLRGATETLKRDAVWMIETFAKTPIGGAVPGHREALETMARAGFKRQGLTYGNYLFSR